MRRKARVLERLGFQGRVSAAGETLTAASSGHTGKRARSKGPQESAAVEVLNVAGTRVALGTCFYSGWTDGDGTRRWRGFLTRLAPTDALTIGTARLRFGSEMETEIHVSELRGEGARQQAIFTGEGPPPSPE